MLEIPDEFYIGKYKITLRCKDNILLSNFQGSTLRGALMSSFYKIGCVQKARDDCEGCLVRENCSFSFLFKSTVTDNSKALSNLKNIPRPYTLFIPHCDNKYLQGEKLNFEITLIGKANKYIGHLILALKRLEEEGIGKGRGKFDLEEITTFNGKSVYKQKEDKIYKKEALCNGEDINNTVKRERLIVDYITPTRLKHEGEYCKKIEFHHLIRNLCRRFSMLSRFYCDKVIDWEFNEIIKKAKDIKLKFNEFNWIEKERYSSTQNQLLTFGGVSGKVCYQGDINYFFPLVKVGSLIQVGKNTTFGLGKYIIK